MPYFKHTSSEGEITLQWLDKEQIESGHRSIKNPVVDGAGSHLKDADGNLLFEDEIELPNFALTNLLPGSIEISEEEASLIKANFESFAEDAQASARFYLVSTDWKILRHTDEMLAKIKPSLSDAELAELLQKRQAARDSLK